ncbi:MULTISPECIES: hypothetical protein [unclassified Paraburkholderia]|uniref:hypothetical protein n=1 Tax=unclassified Paraburkholderia TaxID=2615204 RepID=UPI002AAFA25F|nr:MULTISPECIES: hypothetical protein [unclassified Paraburkholderia]
MSGPKVVRIVTREEILAICEGHLQRLDQAISAWTTAGKRVGELAQSEIDATHARRQALAALIATEAFLDLQKRVPEEITFLHTDLERRRMLAVEKAEQAQKRRRQGRDSANTLLHSLKSKNVDVPAELESQLEQIASGGEFANTDALLARAFALIPTEGPREVSEAQRQLASCLQGDQKVQSVESWKAAQTVVPPQLARVDRQIAEAHVFLTAEETTAFTSRLGVIESESVEGRRNLLLDSLILDLSDAVSRSRKRLAALEEIQELAAELRTHDSDEAKAILARVRRSDDLESIEAVSALLGDCKNAIVAEQQREGAQARRAAILLGLSRLGYEVHEGMSTAWANEGRVVVKKPSLPGYGVEVGGQAQASRLQVRAVALTANRDSTRDKDVETIWCGDFGKLQALLAEHGDNLLVERAMGVGQVPLKIVEDSAQEQANVNPRNTHGGL